MHVILFRAIRRSRIHPRLDKAKFNSLQCGMPAPVRGEIFVEDKHREQTSLEKRPVSDSPPVSMRLLDFQIRLDPIAVGGDGTFQLKGTAVSLGVAEGIARVINDFESEAHLIQRGEILVTNATDTGTRSIRAFLLRFVYWVLLRTWNWSWEGARS